MKVSTMIYPDLTEILHSYCDWDYIVRNKYLRYASALMKQQGKVVYKEIEYHNVHDLKVDLDSECYESPILTLCRLRNRHHHLHPR